MDIQKRNNIISAVLIIVIIGLGYWLYRSIVDPYQKVLRSKAMTKEVHTRMSNIRSVLIKYKNRKQNFPPSLDSLVVFLKTDSVIKAQGASLFKKTIGHYNPDSLIYSPRPPHHEFYYARNDTSNPQLYLLRDPDDSTNTIGSLTQTTLLNAASWE
ncbi:MAG TPA: hypothetical protein VKA34_01120 [Balneolales bacterium]|nr:hypothetical protein [Balneolales bacterium]